MQSPCKRPASSNSYRVLDMQKKTLTWHNDDSEKTQVSRITTGTPPILSRSLIWYLAEKVLQIVPKKPHVSAFCLYSPLTTPTSCLGVWYWSVGFLAFHAERHFLSVAPFGQLDGNPARKILTKSQKTLQRKTLLAKKSLHQINCVLDVEFTFWYTSLNSEMKMV